MPRQGHGTSNHENRQVGLGAYFRIKYAAIKLNLLSRQKILEMKKKRIEGYRGWIRSDRAAGSVFSFE
jgi:hypothetical protein